MRVSSLILVASSLVSGVGLSRAADEPNRIPDPTPGAFVQSTPHQLQFSCARGLNRDETDLAERLAKGEPDERLVAARALWKGRSRLHATEVLKFLAGPPDGAEFRAFRREVEAALQPPAVLLELQKGDYRWGSWLAFLRPHKDLVPALLAGLKDQPELIEETVLALGNSGDRRALDPLVKLLQSKDSVTAGFAARALGYLGDADAEPHLIEALSSGHNWRQVNASVALAKFGSPKALPALEKLAKSDEYTGALAVKGCAADAVESITKREKR